MSLLGYPYFLEHWPLVYTGAWLTRLVYPVGSSLKKFLSGAFDAAKYTKYNDNNQYFGQNLAKFLKSSILYLILVIKLRI